MNVDNLFFKTIILFGIVFVSIQTSAQKLLPNFEILNVNKGLAHNSVFSLHQDRAGFMWFGTPNGLSRYDGEQVVSYTNKESSNTFNNNYIRGKLLEDSKGNIWYSNNTGIFKWDKLKEKVVTEFKFSEFERTDFECLLLQENHTIWMLNVNYGIFSYHIPSKKLSPYYTPIDIDFKKFKSMQRGVTSAGLIWYNIESEKNHFMLFNVKSRKFTNRILNKGFQFYYSTGNPDLEIYCYDTYLMVNNKRVNKSVEGRPLNFIVTNMIRDRSQRIWMATRDAGLICLDREFKEFSNYAPSSSMPHSLPFTITTNLLIDSNNNLWIATDGGGVAKLRLQKPTFNIFPNQASDFPTLKDYFIKCILESKRGEIFIGTQHNGLVQYNPVTNTVKTFVNKIDKTGTEGPGNTINAIFEDSAKNIWVGSSRGVFLFDRKRAKFIPIRYAAENGRSFGVIKISELSDGTIVAACEFQRWLQVTSTKTGYLLVPFSNLSSIKGNCTDFIELPNKDIVVAIPSAGLWYMKKEGSRFRHVYTFFKGIDLRSVRTDLLNDHKIWIATGNGLIYFDLRLKKYKLYDEQNGLSNNYTYGVLQTESNIWISTNRGLSNLNRKSGKFTNYTYLDGLQSNEFNTQAFYKSQSNHFYFGGVAGLNWFNPYLLNKERTVPKVAVTSIEIAGKEFDKDENYATNKIIEIPHFLNDFNFKFAALDFTRTEANKIQYKLDGWDENWVTTLTKTARYNNLPFGNYTLRAKAINGQGVESTEEAIVINILPPFWRQTWFELLAILVCVLIIVLSLRIYIRSRVKKAMASLEKKLAIDLERSRISRDMHDEIGTGLTHIALLGEMISTTNKSQEEVRRDVRTMTSSARSLTQGIAEIIWILNPANESFEALLAYIREQMNQYFEPFGIHFTVDFPDTIPTITLTNEQRRNLYYVTKESLHNALKHAMATSITLKVCTDDGKIVFSVKDNGIGISQVSSQRFRNGMKNIQERMQAIDGQVKFVSNNGITEVEYQIAID